MSLATSIDSVTIAELSNLLGITEARIRHCKYKEGFPEPVGTVPRGCGGVPTALYSYKAVLDFYIAYNEGKDTKIYSNIKTNLFNARAANFMRMKLI